MGGLDTPAHVPTGEGAHILALPAFHSSHLYILLRSEVEKLGWLYSISLSQNLVWFFSYPITFI